MSKEKAEIKQKIQMYLQQGSTLSVMFSQKIADKLKMNPVDLEALEVIMRKENTTAKDLVEATGLTSGSVTALIDRLEKSGFAKRQSDSKDRRKVIIKPNLKKIEKEIFPYYENMANGGEKIVDKLNMTELQIILKFLEDSIVSAKKAIDAL